MKTTIGIITSGIKADSVFLNRAVENMASEFFGVPAQEKNDKGNGILWLTFPSRQNAKDFSEIIRLRCINEKKEVFE